MEPEAAQATEAPWYWNDPAPPTSDTIGMHRAINANPADRNNLYPILADSYADASDYQGDEFYRWWVRDDRDTDQYDGYHFFDNNLVPADASRFRIPASLVALMEHGAVRLPKVHANGRLEPNAGEPILAMGFDGRVLAETTLLAGWRKLTDNERAAILDGNYGYVDPSRSWSMG